MPCYGMYTLSVLYALFIALKKTISNVMLMTDAHDLRIQQLLPLYIYHLRILHTPVLCHSQLSFSALRYMILCIFLILHSHTEYLYPSITPYYSTYSSKQRHTLLALVCTVCCHDSFYCYSILTTY